MWGESPKVPHAGQGYIDESAQERKHPFFSQGHHAADGHTDPQFELGDRALGLGDDRPLSRDGGYLLRGGVEDLDILDGLTQTHVYDDLVQLGDFHDIGIVKVLHQGRDDFLLI